MNRPIVSVAGKKGPFENVLNALSGLDLSRLAGKKVLIKPNVGRKAAPERGYNTHPLAVAGVIEMLQKIPVGEIAIGESPLVGNDTFEAFERAGIAEIARKYHVKLLDLDFLPPVKKNIPGPRVVTATKICAEVYNHDFLISLPVAKTHMHTGVTLGIKNLKGCLYRHEKVRYHQLDYIEKEYPEKTLDSAISDLATILLPGLTIIDGYIGMEGMGPSGGTPVKSDFAVASFNPLGADITGCILMGIEPRDIPHLKLVAERLKFSLEEKDYLFAPADYKQYIHPYKKPPKTISMKFKNIKVHDQESCSSCLSTLMLFLKRFNEEVNDYLLDDGKFHIAIGKGITNPKVGTVCLGNCTKRHKDKTLFIPGCPPVASRIYEAITGKEPDENEPEVH